MKQARAFLYPAGSAGAGIGIGVDNDYLGPNSNLLTDDNGASSSLLPIPMALASTLSTVGDGPSLDRGAHCPKHPTRNASEPQPPGEYGCCCCGLMDAAAPVSGLHCQYPACHAAPAAALASASASTTISASACGTSELSASLPLSCLSRLSGLSLSIHLLHHYTHSRSHPHSSSQPLSQSQLQWQSQSPMPSQAKLHVKSLAVGVSGSVSGPGSLVSGGGGGSGSGPDGIVTVGAGARSGRWSSFAASAPEAASALSSELDDAASPEVAAAAHRPLAPGATAAAVPTPSVAEAVTPATAAAAGYDAVCASGDPYSHDSDAWLTLSLHHATDVAALGGGGGSGGAAASAAVNRTASVGAITVTGMCVPPGLGWRGRDEAGQCPSAPPTLPAGVALPAAAAVPPVEAGEVADGERAATVGGERLATGAGGERTATSGQGFTMSPAGSMEELDVDALSEGLCARPATLAGYQTRHAADADADGADADAGYRAATSDVRSVSVSSSGPPVECRREGQRRCSAGGAGCGACRRRRSCVTGYMPSAREPYASSAAAAVAEFFECFLPARPEVPPPTPTPTATPAVLAMTRLPPSECLGGGGAGGGFGFALSSVDSLEEALGGGGILICTEDDLLATAAAAAMDPGSAVDTPGPEVLDPARAYPGRWPPRALADEYGPTAGASRACVYGLRGVDADAGGDGGCSRGPGGRLAALRGVQHNRTRSGGDGRCTGSAGGAVHFRGPRGGAAAAGRTLDVCDPRALASPLSRDTFSRRQHRVNPRTGSVRVGLGACTADGYLLAGGASGGGGGGGRACRGPGAAANAGPAARAVARISIRTVSSCFGSERMVPTGSGGGGGSGGGTQQTSARTWRSTRSSGPLLDLPSGWEGVVAEVEMALAPLPVSSSPVPPPPAAMVPPRGAPGGGGGKRPNWLSRLLCGGGAGGGCFGGRARGSGGDSRNPYDDYASEFDIDSD